MRDQRRRSWLAFGGACGTLGAFAAWEGVQGRYSTASHVSTVATIVVVLALGVRAGRGRQRSSSRRWANTALRAVGKPAETWRTKSPAAAGAVAWALLLAATITWDAISFIVQEHRLPTLSRLLGDVTDHDWGRALLFAAWLALGLYLAVGWRQPAPDREKVLGPERAGHAEEHAG